VAVAGRSALIVVAILAVGAAAVFAVIVATRGNDDGLIPDRIQPGPQADPPASAPAPAAPAARCPAGVAGCRVVSGRIVYVEAVDPDGDGDAHFVLADSEGVTGPGITVVDVPPALRPHPLPGVGAHLSAAGILETGSFDQTQIGAVALGG
jgi:hypothetical protein